MISELVTRVFTRRDQAHLAHWATQSYAEHVALDEFYNGVVGALDDIVENFQGCFKPIGRVNIPAFSTPKDVLTELKDDVKWITSHRSDIAKDIQHLENLIDNLTAVYTKTIYKLDNLS